MLGGIRSTKLRSVFWTLFPEQGTLQKRLPEAGHETHGQQFPKSEGGFKKGSVSAKPVALTAISSWAPEIITCSGKPWPKAIPMPQPPADAPTAPLQSSLSSPSSTCMGPGSCRTLGHPRSLRLNDKRAPMWIITSPPHRCRSVPPRFLGKRTIPCSPPAFPAPPRAGSAAQVSRSGFSPGRHQPPALPPLLLHDPIYPFHATTPRPPRQSSSLQSTSPTQEEPGKDK